jgi:hypothetical protein
MASPIVANAVAMFASCLLRLTFRYRFRMESTYTGSRRRAPNQSKTSMLRHAIDTVGTHGLGMTRKDGRS